MNRTNIEWCEYTWNPITGCKRGCRYCYAKRINDRFNKTPFDKIIVHKNRWDEPIKLKTPSVIFVGSMSDICYWNKDNLDGIIMTCGHCSWHTFMFLSKDSLSYTGKIWPENTMQGLTLTGQQSPREQEDEHENMKLWPRPFLSIEPIMGNLFYDRNLNIYEKVIVGAMTGRKALEPKKEWIESVAKTIPEDKTFWKNNIKTSRAFIEVFGVVQNLTASSL